MNWIYLPILALVIASIITTSKYLNYNTDNTDETEIQEGFGRGPRGGRGASGPSGPQGNRGIPGIRGPPGSVGPKGPMGKDGPLGKQGPVGPNGPKGPKGDRGFDGFPGPHGPIGVRGDIGPIGHSGPRGLEGKPGRDGKAGSRGFPGMKGEPGTFGSNSCQFFGSDEQKGWQCPDSHPVYAGATMGGNGSKLFCSGGVAKNASCSGASGTGAKAKVFTNAGQIADIKITKGGRNYKYPPHVKVIATKGYGAILKAEVSSGSVSGISIIDGGQDYNEPPELQFETVDGGYGATASTIIDNGRVVAVNMVHTGQNYLIPPSVEFRGGAGKGAAAIAEINEGHVISIRISSGGAGYTYSPVVVITPGSSKAGCGFCHMCCKKNPDAAGKGHTGTVHLQKQYESRMEQTESELQKINSLLHDQQNMLQLALESGQRMQAQSQKETQMKNKSESKNKSKSKSQPAPASAPINQAMQQRRGREKLGQEITKDRKNIDKMIVKAAKNSKHIDIKELDDYRKRLAKKPGMAEQEKIKRMMEEQQRLKPRKYQDWAKLGKANQSSTKGTYTADKAIDGNLNTFNMTNISGNGPAWTQVKLPKDIEISKIKVGSRLGSYDIRRRLPPFSVEVYNDLGAKVGSKRFKEIQNEYIWNDVELVGRTIKIIQEELNHMNLNDISVYGEQALSCDEYSERFAKYRNLVDKILLDPKSKLKLSSVDAGVSIGNKDLYIKNRRLYKKLMDSCNKLDGQTQIEKSALIKERAAAYDKVLAKSAALKQIKANKAKKLWNKVKVQQEKEKKTAEEAKKLGLPPPPPMYSETQIKLIKKNLKFNTKKMDTKQKAMCMHLLNEAMSKRSSAVSYGRTAAFIPFLIPTAKKKGRRSESAWQLYNRLCDPD